MGFDYRDVWRAEHAAHFTVAKVVQADVLADIRSSLEDALQNGKTFETWKKDLKPALEAKGWWRQREVIDTTTGEIATTTLGAPRRLRTIYHTNLRQARAAGQWARIQRTKAALPYLLYQVGPSIQHRPEHLAWHGTLLPVDHPWWTTHLPMNGWGCKCHVRAVSRAEYQRLQREGVSTPLTTTDPRTGAVIQVLTPQDTLATTRRPPRLEAPPSRMVAWTNRRTGQTEHVPAGIDPGFDVNPGTLHHAAHLVAQKVSDLPADLGATTWGPVQPFVQPRLASEFAQWAGRVVQAAKASGEQRVVGVLKPGLVKQLRERNLELDSAALIMRDESVLHALRRAKQDASTQAGQRKGLTLEQLQQLPALIEGASAVLLEAGASTLLLVYPELTRGAGKIVVQLEHTQRQQRRATLTGRVPRRLNAVRTVSLVQLVDIANDLRSGKTELLQGKIE